MGEKKTGKNAVRRVFAAEEAVLAARYRDLYGEGNYQQELQAYRRRRNGMLLLFAVGFALVFTYAAVREYGGVPGARYGEDGRLLAVERPAEGASATAVAAKVYAVSPQGTITENKDLYISSYSDRTENEKVLAGESHEDVTRRKIDQAVRQAGQDRSAKVVQLPEQLDDGTKLVWVRRRSSVLPMLFLLFAAGLYYLYKSRFAAIAGKEKEARESVIRELPELLHKLILLLGAGVVLTPAFERAIEDVRGDSYFAQQMLSIKERAAMTNASVHVEFCDFAQRSGVLELVRVAGILSDHVERGTDLTDKLREESRLLWFERKKQSEEKGRLAETKLTMPLALLLMVLVLVTVSPALFEM